MGRIPKRLWLAIVVGAWCLSGASCPRSFLWNQPNANLPPALPPNATLEQVVQVVNGRNSQIQSFSTNQASLSVSGAAASLRANIAYERSRRLRLRADLLMSPELDIGSNDDLFWFWVKRAEPPAIYFCRHDQFATSPARQMTPFEPQWLIEALGMVEFDPLLQHEGPVRVPGGLEICTTRPTPQGPAKKYTVVDPRLGVVVEQRYTDAAGQVLAIARASNFQRDPLSGIWTPGTIQIFAPPAQFSMRLDLGAVALNQPIGNPVELWSMPRIAGTQLVDLGDPNFRPPAVAGVRITPPPASPPGQWNGQPVSLAGFSARQR